MRLLAASLLLAAVAGFGSQAAAQSEPSLTIGSKAPAIDVDHWFDLRPEGSEGEAVEPITGFDQGRVYVVEFWATWCGPCVGSIPHISELQESYRDRGVTILSISDENPASIEPFFEREVINYRGDAETRPTYRELMSAYRVGSDGDASVSRDYMEAAGRDGIPCAFVVGKTGLIEWIGHPGRIDSVLEAVVSDAWDRAAFAEEFRKEQRVEFLQVALGRAMQSGQFDQAREMAAEFAELAGQPELEARINRAIDQAEFFRLVMTDTEAAKARFAELAAALEGDVQGINELAWRFSQLAARGQSIDADLLKAVTETAEAALDADAPDLSLLDTVAHLRHAMGDLDAALVHQRAALAAFTDEYPPEARQQIAGFLKQLEAEKAAQSEGE